MNESKMWELSPTPEESFYDRERRRGTELVMMNSVSEIASSDQEVKRIATFGLCGCSAVVSLFQTELGYSAVLGHFDPIQAERELGEGSLGQLHNHLAGHAHEQATVLILTPGDWQKDDESGKYTLEPKQMDIVRKTRDYLEKNLQNLNETRIRCYSENQLFGAKDQGTLLVELPPNNSDGPVVAHIEGIPEQL